MNCYFFTYVDDNPKYRAEADLLIRSGRRFGREIHRFDIPAGAMWNRYKVELLAGKLPAADRYICLDSDTILTGPGDWEADDCQGVMDILYYMAEPDRIKHTQAFIRNHTLLDGDPGGYEYILDLWRQMDCPIWYNSGVVVLDADWRLDFAEDWKRWISEIDLHCDRGYVVGDEAPLMFLMADSKGPRLHPRFNGCCKWQPIHDGHVLLHADGNVTGEKRIPYNLAVQDLLEYERSQ